MMFSISTAQNLTNGLVDFFKTLTGEQIVALLFAIYLLSMAAKVIKKGLSLVLSVAGVLCGLYFIAPELYAQVLNALIGIWNMAKGLIMAGPPTI